MPLDRVGFKNDLKAMMDTLATSTEDPEVSRDYFATQFAIAIENFIKSGDGVYQPASLQAGPNAVVPIQEVAIKIQ